MRVVWLRLRLAALLCGLLVIGPSLAAAQSAPDLRQPPAADWQTIGGDWSGSRYSSLNQITTSNVAGLKGAWVTHLGSGLATKYSLEATPLVQNGVMYVPSGNDDLFVLDAASGQEVWEYHSGIDQNISTVCCGWDNRGVALGEGLVFMGSSMAAWLRSTRSQARWPGRHSSKTGEMATPSPRRRCITTGSSIRAFPEASAASAAA